MPAVSGYARPPGLLNPQWNNWVNPGAPIGLKGVLGKYFDPREMRYRAGSEALLQAGLGILNPDPHAPPSGIAGLLGRGISGAAQGARQGRDDFYNEGMQNMQLMDMQRQEDERAAVQAEINKILPTLPPDMQGFARAHPDRFFETYMKVKMGGGGDRYGANAYWGQGQDGRYHLFQPDKQGGPPVEMQMPEGINPVPGTTYLDTGTGFQPMPNKGMGAGGAPVPKDLAGAEREKVIGKGAGEAAVDYKSISSKMPGLEHVVRELSELAKAATYTSTGQLVDLVIRETGQEPRESAVARARYIAIVDNQILPMLRDTFGAQFTQKEGESLKVTLGDPNKSPAEKQAVLEAFIEQKRRNIEDMARMAGEQSDPSAVQQPKRLRYNPATGELE